MRQDSFFESRKYNDAGIPVFSIDIEVTGSLLDLRDETSNSYDLTLAIVHRRRLDATCKKEIILQETVIPE